MCTLSWYSDHKGYHVFFNRDEQRSRAAAYLPEVYSRDDCKIIMPLDPVGRGSWLAVNDLGVTIALINYYQGGRGDTAKSPELRSRGEIVKKLADCESNEDFIQRLRLLPLQYYTPFSIVCFDPELMSIEAKTLDNISDEEKSKKILAFRWNGEKFSALPELKSPLISSGFRVHEVTACRQAHFEKETNLNSDDCGVTTHRKLHSSHLPEKSAYSVCMHRDDAKTVSFSHIQVTGEKVIFEYTDGPPCQSEAVITACTPRKANSRFSENKKIVNG